MTVYLTLGTLLVALVYFAVATIGLSLLFSPVVGLLGFGFFRLVDAGARNAAAHWRMVGATAVGAALGAGLAMALGVSQNPLWDWIGVVVSVLIASTVFTITGRSASEPCALCKTPIKGDGLECPRCSDHVCTRPTCWNAKHARCSRCHQREVVIFPIAERWWDARVGRRVMKGECSSCYKEAHEANLRECGQCHWPMCQRCWDYHNGICQRCEWMIPDLPPKLVAFLGTPRRARKTARTGRRASPSPEPAPPPPRAAGGGSTDDTIAQPGPRPRR